MCELINLAHIRHDHIPAVRASGGPLYQKTSECPQTVFCGGGAGTKWRSGYVRLVQSGEWLYSPGNDCTALEWLQPWEWLYSPGNDCTARGMTVQPWEWLYSPGNDYTAQGMTVQPWEWLYSPGNDCTARGMTVQPREWLYSPGNDCTARGMTVQPGEWLYVLPKQYTICCTTEKLSQYAKLIQQS